MTSSLAFPGHTNTHTHVWRMSEDGATLAPALASAHKLINKGATAHAENMHAQHTKNL